MSDRRIAATVITAERASQLMFDQLELVMQGRTARAWARPVIAIALAQKARQYAQQHQTGPGAAWLRRKPAAGWYKDRMNAAETVNLPSWTAPNA
jgi:hypothetical protein